MISLFEQQGFNIVSESKETSTMLIIELSIFKDVSSYENRSHSISNEVSFSYKKSIVKNKLPKFWSNKGDNSKKLTYKIGKFCFDKSIFLTELSEILMKYKYTE